MNEQMDCLKFRAHLDEWFDGELNEDMARAMQDHIDACPDCAEDARLAREALDMIHSLEDEIPVPLAAQAAWRKAVRADMQQQKRRRFPAAIRAIGSVAAALIVLAGCTAAFRANDVLYPTVTASEPADVIPSTDAVYIPYSRSMDAPIAEAAVVTAYVASDGSADEVPTVAAETEAAIGTGEVITVQPVSPMLIRSVERTITTDNYDSAGQKIRDLTEQYGGYMATDAASISDNGLRTAQFTAVIPAVEADNFLQTIDHVGNVTYTAEYFEDAAPSVQDIAIRMQALEAERTRLTELIAEATDAAELKQLSALLQATVSEIGLLETESTRLQNDLDNVRISITLVELYPSYTANPTAEPALTQLMGNAFSRSAHDFHSFIRDMAVTLMIIAPYVICLALIIILVLATMLIVRRIRRK